MERRSMPLFVVYIKYQSIKNFNSQDFTELFFIEESWEQIVKSSSKMTRQQQKRQSAIWEFIQTEANYLKYLRSIIDYYLSPFLEIHEYLFENLDVEWIFSNIEEIFKANIKLWLQYLIEPLNEIRRNGNAFTPVTFKSAITHWADQQGHDHREPLWDQMTKPTTRLTQYRLIMESIRNNCSNSIEEQEISEMLKSISEFIEGINQQMTETKTWESLEMLTSKLIYDDLYENGVEDYTQLINDHTKFKFSLLSPIKLPFPIILFNEQNYIYQQTIPSCTKSLALLRNRRLSGSSLFTLNNNSITDIRTVHNYNTTSCNRSDSVLLTRFSSGGIYKSIIQDTDMNESIAYDWSDIYYLFLITKSYRKDGNDYWKLLKNPVRLDKLVIQRGRETDDFHNIANLYIFSAGNKCDEWIAQIELAKENYRKLMEPEVLIAQPLMIDQRYDSSTNVISSDMTFNSDNISELPNTGLILDTSSTSGNIINRSNSNDGSKRNVFFTVQSSSLENINNNNADDSMNISDKRIRTIISPIVHDNNQRYSSRSYKDTSIQSNSSKLSHLTNDRNLLPYNHTSDRHLLNASNKHDKITINNLSLIENCKSTSISSLRKDDDIKLLLHHHHEKQQSFTINHQNESRLSRDSSDHRIKLKSPINIINIRPTSCLTSSKSINDNKISLKSNLPIQRNDYHRHHLHSSILTTKSNVSLLSTSKNEMKKTHVNRPSILICKARTDSNETSNSNTTTNNNNNIRLLSSIGLHHQSVHQSLLHIERSDSSDDQITVKS
ncbi:Pleckstrin homology domain-containing family G member 6 [Schistosoma japonicum]|nr:Pleckstrin homology domain-containing family G member 6 [Schistosoma japonicum]